MQNCHFSIFGMISKLSLFHFFIEHKSHFIKSLKNGILNYQKVLFGAILWIGPFF
jgi:hypothetical protein